MQSPYHSANDTHRVLVEIEPHITRIDQLLPEAFLGQTRYVIKRSFDDLASTS